MPNDEFEEIVVRSTDWENLRTIRRRMFELAPLSFGGNIDAEQLRDDSDWQRWARDSEEGLRRRCWAATSDGEWVASAFCDYEGSSARSGLVYGMWTEEGWRRKGLAQRLLTSLESWAVDKGATTLRLKVNVNNSSAIRLYEKFGFKDTGERSPMRNNPSQTMMSMEKIL